MESGNVLLIFIFGSFIASPFYSNKQFYNNMYYKWHHGILPFITYYIFRGEICFTNQTGSMPLTQDNLQKAISLATDQALQIRKALKSLS